MKKSLLTAFLAALILFTWNIICLELFVYHADLALKTSKLLQTFGLYFMASVVAICLILRTNLPLLRNRVSFITTLGTFSTFSTALPFGIWQDLPLMHNLFHALAVIFGWFLAGLVIGKMVPPQGK